MTYHLAQINIGRLIAPIDDPRIAEFVAQLAPINALADQAHGFVWRLQSASGNATDIVTMRGTPPSFSTCPFGNLLRHCAITLTNRTTPVSCATVPSGSRKWTSPSIAFGGFRRDTFPLLRKGANGSSTTSNTAQLHFPFGFQSTFLSPRMKVCASNARCALWSPKKKNGWQSCFASLSSSLPS